MSAIRKENRKPLKKAGKQKTKVIQLNAFRQPDETNTEKLANALWKVMHGTLWFGQQFSDKEKENFKKLIAGHFNNGKSDKRNFTDLLERMCLAKRYVARRSGRYIAKPQDWLNVHYPLGLSGTASWLEQVNIIRKNVPDYNKGIAILAKGILKFIEMPSPLTFSLYRDILIEQKQFDLLQIFNNSIINLQYGN